MDWWSAGKHSPPIKSTLWITPKSRKCTPATKPGWGRRWRRPWGLRRSRFTRGPWPWLSQSKTCQGLSPTSRATRLSGTHLAVLPASSTTATAYSLHRLPLRWPPWSTVNLDTAALLEYTMEDTKQENQETAEEPVERVTEKVKDPKKVVAGRAGAAARKAKQEKRLLEQLRVAKESVRPLRATTRLPIFPQRKRQRFPRRHGVKDKLTGPRGSLGLVLQAGRSCFSEARKREDPRRQPPLTPCPSSLPPVLGK